MLSTRGAYAANAVANADAYIASLGATAAAAAGGGAAAAAAAASAGGSAAGSMSAVGPGRYCSPRHPTRVELSFLELGVEPRFLELNFIL